MTKTKKQYLIIFFLFLTPRTVSDKVLVSVGFYRKLNSEQLLFELSFDIIGIFGSVQP